jgi:hypothetical protein
MNITSKKKDFENPFTSQIHRYFYKNRKKKAHILKFENGLHDRLCQQLLIKPVVVVVSTCESSKSCEYSMATPTIIGPLDSNPLACFGRKVEGEN